MAKKQKLSYFDEDADRIESVNDYNPPDINATEMTYEALLKQERRSIKKRFRILAQIAKDEGDERFDNIVFSDEEAAKDESLHTFNELCKWLIDNGKFPIIKSELEHLYGDRVWYKEFKASEFIAQLRRMRDTPADVDNYLPEEEYPLWNEDMKKYRRNASRRMNLWFRTLNGENPPEYCIRRNWVVTDLQEADDRVSIFFHGDGRNWCWTSDAKTVSTTAQVLAGKFKRLGKGMPVTIVKFRELSIEDKNGITAIDSVWTA